MRNTARAGNRVRSFASASTTSSNRCAKDTKVYGDVRKAKQSSAVASRKEGNTQLSPAAQLKIIKLYLEGNSFCEITRRTGYARQTVTKVCRSEDVQTTLQELRGKLLGESDDWVESLNYAVTREQNAAMAYRLLKDFGVIPSPEKKAKKAQPQAPYVWHNNDPETMLRAKILGEEALRRGHPMSMEREELEKLASETKESDTNLTLASKMEKRA